MWRTGLGSSGWEGSCCVADAERLEQLGSGGCEGSDGWLAPLAGCIERLRAQPALTHSPLPCPLVHPLASCPAEVERSILGDGCVVEPDARIFHSVVGLRSIIREVGGRVGGGWEGGAPA